MATTIKFTKMQGADYNAEVVVKTLFQKYYENPRLLHTGTLQKIFHDTLMHKNTAVSNSAVCLNDCSVSLANAEIEEMALKPLELPNDTKAQKTIRLEKRKILSNKRNRDGSRIKHRHLNFSLQQTLCFM